MATIDENEIVLIDFWPVRCGPCRFAPTYEKISEEYPSIVFAKVDTDAEQALAGKVQIHKDACVPCGRCVTSCPKSAIENPAATPAMIDAQVRAVMDAAEKPIGIRFVCSRGSVDAESEWVDIGVPCASMIPASWLLACRLLGASCAKAVPCGDSSCAIDGDSIVTVLADPRRRMLACRRQSIRSNLGSKAIVNSRRFGSGGPSGTFRTG